MLNLPFEYNSTSYYHSYTNLLHLVLQITKISELTNQPGVWVASTDMHLSFLDDFFNDGFSFSSDITLFSTFKNKQSSKSHGVLYIEKGRIEDLFYQGSSDEIEQCVDESGHVQVVLGLVRLSIRAAVGLLELHVEPPLDGCTYSGVDSGAPPLGLGLILDIVVSILPGSGPKEDEALARRGVHWHHLQSCRLPSSGGGGGGDVISPPGNTQRYCAALKRLRAALSHLSVDFVSLEGNSCTLPAFSLNASEFLKDIFAIRDLGTTITEAIDESFTFSYMKYPRERSDNLIAINSLITGKEIELSGKSLVMHCHLTLEKLQVRDTCLIGLDSELCEAFLSCRRFPDATQLAAYRIDLKIPGSTPSLTVPCSWGRFDDLTLSEWKGTATIFNEPWVVFRKRTGIAKEDLWSTGVPSERTCLLTARLFPVLGLDSTQLTRVFHWLWGTLDEVEDATAVLELWRGSWRFSLDQLLEHSSGNSEAQWRRALSRKIARLKVRDVLTQGQDAGLRRVFRTSVAESWSLELLDELDSVVELVLQDVGLTARALACIGDLLGCMANDAGGLRSGPAANRAWQPAYILLEKGELSQGIALMRKLRAVWLTEPELLIRAARHYEGASQMLIRRAVLTCREPLPPAQPRALQPRLVVAEAPARLDLSGGWSDTPPICYENGGCVVNLAVLVNGERPIGAQAKVLEDIRGLRLVLGESTHILVDDLDGIRDYNKPNAPGNLLKASLVFSELLDLCDGGADLVSQLQKRFGEEFCGLELSTWSNLPSGSGLGTSSILAACVLAALWRLAGLQVGHEALLRGVLVVEQLMTTGGGWQDQVGGVLEGGVKVARSPPGLPLRLMAQTLQPPAGFLSDLSNRLVLIYTGKTRLARNLLQEVVRNWYARNPSVTDTVHDLVRNAERCAEAITRGNLEDLSDCIQCYWKQKKVMAGSAAEPAVVTAMLTALRPYLSAASLAGAGGGGFLYGLLRVSGHIEALSIALAKFNSKNSLSAELFDVELDCEGLVITTVTD